MVTPPIYNIINMYLRKVPRDAPKGRKLLKHTMEILCFIFVLFSRLIYKTMFITNIIILKTMFYNLYK